MSERVLVSELVVGDVISFEFASEGGFDTAVIVQIEGEQVLWERLYAHIGDVMTTAGISVTYGVERGSFWIKDSRKILRLQKSRVGEHWTRVERERKGLLDEIARLKTLLSQRTLERDAAESELDRKGVILKDLQKQASRATEDLRTLPGGACAAQ